LFHAILRSVKRIRHGISGASQRVSVPIRPRLGIVANRNQATARVPLRMSAASPRSTWPISAVAEMSPAQIACRALSS
jgi:hypothetical protein